jgi:peptide/nickel transport system substrate-binding protein
MTAEPRTCSRRAWIRALVAASAGATAFVTLDHEARALPPVQPNPPKLPPKPKTQPAPAPIRMAWPWPVHAPDPWSSSDVVSALLGVTLFPPLYVRAIDGYIEPKLAIGAPKERKLGVRVDLQPHVRPSDVVASLAKARTGGARLVLRDIPVPRVDGQHGVLFPFVGDIDGLMRKLATPLAGIARIEPRRFDPTGVFEMAVEEIATGRLLRLKRRVVWGMTTPALTLPNRVRIFELEGATELAPSLRAFERGDTDVSWLGDGLFAARPGARSIDLGPLAYLGLRAGKDVPELAHAGGILGLVESIPKERLDHLGLMRRGHVAPTAASAFARSVPNVPPGVPLLVRASLPVAVAAAEILARDIGATVQAIDDGAFERSLAEGIFSLALDVVRPIDDTENGAAIALATFDGATTAPAASAGPHSIAAAGSAALGWEIALLGAEAGDVWIPRASFGGLDLEGGGEA